MICDSGSCLLHDSVKVQNKRKTVDRQLNNKNTRTREIIDLVLLDFIFSSYFMSYTQWDAINFWFSIRSTYIHSISHLHCIFHIKAIKKIDVCSRTTYKTADRHQKGERFRIILKTKKRVWYTNWLCCILCYFL